MESQSVNVAMPRERNNSVPILLEDDGMVNLGLVDDDGHSI